MSICPICKKLMTFTSDGFWCDTHGYPREERGRKGGKARAAKLSARERSEIARKGANARWSKDVSAENEFVILSVKLSTGNFDSEIRVPMLASDEDKKQYMEAWFALIEAGIKAGRSHRESQKTFTNREVLEKILRNAPAELSRDQLDNPSDLAYYIIQELTKQRC